MTKVETNSIENRGGHQTQCRDILNLCKTVNMTLTVKIRSLRGSLLFIKKARVKALLWLL